MPLLKTIKKVLVIGSGPIVIGQAAEFDYAGTQACRILKEEGVQIILVNSNPATIMTDNAMADKIYIEPLTLPTIKRIIEKERPDSILSGLGGQTGLTLCMQLAKDGYLEEMGVKLLGSSAETIDKAEDRQIFKDTMEKIGQPCIPSLTVHELEEAVDFANKIGYPVIVRPAFTLGGSGGGIADDEKTLREIAKNGLAMSPIHQILVERSVAGWKEIEFEVMRDSIGNCIAVCSMENFDPVGVHTGDSIVIAPAVTLSDTEYQMLRRAALDIIEELGVEGGCNCQFALDPHSMNYGVIEVNPRVSRSSALASKATGYPIAKVATKIALGYTLDEIPNAVTGKTFAAFEPTLDYVAVKFPKWPFDKFVYAKKDLGTQMKATGEVMSISDTFEDAILKAVRGAEIGLSDLNMPKLKSLSNEEIYSLLNKATDERLFVVYEALLRGYTVDEIHNITKIDRWFLNKLVYIKNDKLSKEPFIYKMVDTCGGEFEAVTPYFYSIRSKGENEALPFIEKSEKERVVVLGSGPIRIGQGIEFDYSSVHCVNTLKGMGYEVIVINNNPETVSTDFDTADRLYFEPLCIDDVMSIIEIEKPIGVIVAFGGGTAIKLTQKLHDRGVTILGTSADSIDACEDRERFDDLLQSLDIDRPRGYCIMTKEEAFDAAKNLGYPVLMRPSYVLGGQNMIIAFSDSDISEYMDIIMRQKQDNPVLIDKYLSGMEVEVDAICDGEKILIPGIMEHIERTGVHSGDSIAVYPAVHVEDDMANRIFECTEKICMALNVKGLVNLQYIVIGDKLYVIEVNPRASRTVPYLSKVTGVPICELATKASLGMKMEDLGYGTGIYKVPPYVAVKVPVFSFEKLTDVDTHLGPEMKSTGEVLGIGKTLKEALYKGLVAANYKMNAKGSVFMTVRNTDKGEIAEIAKKFSQLGFTLCATDGTADVIRAAGLDVKVINKIHENPEENTMTLLESGTVSYIISTSERGRNPVDDDVKIRRRACNLGIPSLTSLDTANALADSLLSRHSEKNTELVDINNMRTERVNLDFSKMQSGGNDYVFINCIDNEVNSPESLSAILSDRHMAIGADGVISISKSNIADVKMTIFDLDGSERAMCGNAIRCAVKYLYDKGIVVKKVYTIETGDGVKTLHINTQYGIVSSVKMYMGNATVKISDTKTSLQGIDRETAVVNFKNSHKVILCEEVASVDLASLATDSNVEILKIIDKNTIKVRAFEYGVGENYSYDEGVCAAAVAAVQMGYCDRKSDIRVLSINGEMTVNFTGDSVFLTGEANRVFDGVIEL